MELVPCLAESWEQVDNKTLIFKLKKGVKFHNGEPFTANDVKFTFDMLRTAPAMMAYFGDLDDTEVIDDYTVKVTAKKPYGPLINYMAHTGASILNEKAVKAAGSDYSQHPVGTGPFKFVSWSAGDRIVLEANPDYWDGAVATKQLIFRTIPEGTNRTIALETKEIDIGLDIDPIDTAMLKNHKDINLIQGDGMSMTYMGFNTTAKPLNDKRVRQAIAYAINLDDIADVVFQKAAQKANGVVTTKVVGRNNNLKPYTPNLEKAKALLTEAGYPNGFKLKLWTNNNTARMDSAIVIQDQLKPLGIDVTIEMLEWGAYLDRLSRKEHELFMLGWSTSPDADSAMYSLFHSSNHGASGNRTWFTNSKVDELLDQGRASTDQTLRVKLYQEAQEIIQDEVPMLALVYPYQNIGILPTVKGFVPNPESQHRFVNVSAK
jgi:peptide/nickel transport system substrate-binding protein